MTMTTNQKAALIVAQVQPSAASRPNRTRRLVVPVLSACCAIVLPSLPAAVAAGSLGRQRARHVRVHLAEELVRPRREPLHVVRLGVVAVEDVAGEHGRPR